MEGLADFITTSLSHSSDSLMNKSRSCNVGNSINYSNSNCSNVNDGSTSYDSASHMPSNLGQQNNKNADGSGGGDLMDVVQQREVSSSKPSPSSLLNHSLVGPLLLQALDGFLVIVGTDGVIEFASENIGVYLNYSAMMKMSAHWNNIWF
ncbi:hypothetical protein HELRODRAFT_167640 [Helobdella robusta]|uniref:PAS domain-containing protein n=1 Tax=Helobdella robusta TaxID=6412 RepID=T1EZL5_HELRO|nr:hypothetical protein HELRODRAFT_167640 [Helobdella robusta]ESO09830.1 hypothetical protein HELRODRAFT_167640 [Helobdella robusta]